MSRKNFVRVSSIAFAAVAAVAGLGVAAPAFAQSNDRYYDDRYVVDDRITVIAPYTVEVERDRTSLGAPSEISVTQLVSASDLDLRYDPDVAELNRRVAFAAELACEQAEDLMAGSLTTDRECERQAVRGAQSQVRVAIAADGGWYLR